MVRKQQAMPLPTTQATPPIRFAPEDVDNKVSSKTNRTPARKCSKGQCCTSRCLTRWIMRLSIFYVLFAALWRCPSQPFSFSYDPNHEQLVCREMASIQEHVSPVVHEFATSAHRFMEPYAGKYMNAAHETWKKMEPVVHKSAKQAHTVYWNHVEPGARELYKQAYKWSLPHQKAAHAHYKKHLRPHVKKFSKTMSPYVKTYYKDVHPHIVKVSRQLQHAYDRLSQYYVDKVHPSIKQRLYQLYLYLRHTLFPMAHGHYMKHAHPHVSHLYKQVSKYVDGMLRKYGLKKSTLMDSAKDTYTKVKEAVIPSESAVPDESNLQESASSDEIDPETGESTAVLQARLDAELERVESKLNVEESAMSRLVNKETSQILADIAEMRRRALPLMPERLERILQVGIDGGIASVFLRAVRELKARSAQLPPGALPSEEWKESARAWLSDQIDTLVDVYDDMRTAASELTYATRGAEEQMIQASVAKIRAQSRQALRTFYDVMEEAEFQATYYENEGWDTVMKRRGRYFRESVMESLAQMSIIGDEISDGQESTTPHLEVESSLILSAIDDLFKGMEQGLNALTDRLLEDPSVFHDRTAYAQLLVDLHEHLDALSAAGHEIAVNSTLRLRDLIYDVRESLNMTRIPDEGLLLELAPRSTPLDENDEVDDAAQLTEPVTKDASTTLSDDDTQFATILPVDDALLREAETLSDELPSPPSASETETETLLSVPTLSQATDTPFTSSEMSSLLPSLPVAPPSPSAQVSEATEDHVAEEPTLFTSTAQSEPSGTLAEELSETTRSVPPAPAATEAAEETLHPTLSMDTEPRVKASTPVLAPTSLSLNTPVASTHDTSASSILAETKSTTDHDSIVVASATTTPSLEWGSTSSTVPEDVPPTSPPRPSATMARMPRPVNSGSQSFEADSIAPRHDEL